MSAPPTEISTAELVARVQSPGNAVVDVRSPAAYNGWRRRAESRGGHVPGATNVATRWLGDADPSTVLRARGITPDQQLSLYGYERESAERTAEQLRAVGFDDLSVYTAFLDEWVPNEQYPLASLPRHRRLVYPEWVRTLVRGGDPPAAPEGDFEVCHVHADDRRDYEQGHVPGAIPLDTRRLEAPDDWNRRPPDELETALLDHGIRSDTTVILYGRPAGHGGDDTATGDECSEAAGNDATAGHMAAMRCATILLYAGVDDVRVLDGGLTAWTAAGFEVTTAPTRPEPVEAFGREVPARPDVFVDTPEARAWLATENRHLVSVRSYGELAVETSGYDYVSEAGRIPGAIYAPSGSDAHHVEEYRNPDGTMRYPQEVADAWVDRGVDPDDDVAFYCGTGWRASEAFVHAYLLGWPGVAVYDGGWFEWSKESDAPVDASGETCGTGEG